jgi:hypothetical protein
LYESHKSNKKDSPPLRSEGLQRRWTRLVWRGSPTAGGFSTGPAKKPDTMIEAERAALSAETLHSSLNILEREMTVTLNHLNNIATNAALLGGFVFAFVGGVGEDVHPIFEGIYMALTVASLGLLMYAVLCATLASSLAPNKAFKDREHASMRIAMECLKSDQRMVNRAFNSGVALFTVVVAMHEWKEVGADRWPIFAICTAIILSFSAATTMTMRRMVLNYALSSPDDGSVASRGVVSGSKFLSMVETVESNTATSRPHVP